MPHKHKRSRRDNDDSIHDLPPTVIAKPLAPKDFTKTKTQKGKNGKNKNVTEGRGIQNKRKRGGVSASESAAETTPAAATDTATATGKGQKKKQKKRAKTNQDDTPKAFLRIMQQMAGKKLDRGPDDGNDRRNNKKNNKKTSTATTTDADDQPTTPAETNKKPDPSKSSMPMPTILPGEKLSDFAARVDQAMPLSGIAKRHNVGVPGLKIRETRTTKHEKHLRRLQKGWREEEARLRAKEEEEREERDAAMEELEEQWRELEAEAGPRKKRKGSKKGKKEDEEDDDPWAALNKKVKEERKRNPLETVEAPPVLTKLRPKFKVYGGAKVSVENVPGAAGSLRRREELREERESVVEQYRRLMAEKRGNSSSINV